MQEQHSSSQPHSTQLVSAHQFQKKRAKHVATIPRIIERVFDPHSAPLLRLLVQRSLDGIKADFYPGEDIPELPQLRALQEKAPHTTLLALFLLLLNVDTKLKEHVLAAEDTQRSNKVVRFFLDLKQYAVVNFFSNDTTTPVAFTQTCHEIYLVA